MARFPLLVLVLLAATAHARAEAGSIDSVFAEVEKIHGEPGMRTASIGFCMIPVDAENDGDAAGYRMDTGLVPGSTLKAVTTATALDILGVDFRFETEIQYTGTIADDGTLHGDIVVKGGGDPTLGASPIAGTFVKWQAALAEAGISGVEGSVVGDDSIFGTQLVPDTWQWSDIGNYYAAGACGLSFHRNRFYCNFRTGAAGTEAVLAGTDPLLPGIQFVNEMRVGPAGSGDHGYIYGHPYGTTFYLRGTVPAGGAHYTIKGSLPDPAFFCARAFTKHLNQHGIPVRGEPTTARLMKIDGKAPGERQSLLTQRSDPLASLIVLTNHQSDNLRAECIHRMIGLKKGAAGSTIEAATATTAHWTARGIDMTGFVMADGCGLSRSNTITARQLALIHRHAAASPAFDAFFASLPVAGRSGTLKSIGAGSAAEGRIHAKSGTLDRIRNYTGYVETDSGTRYAFAFLINNYTCELSEVKARVVRVWTRMIAL